MTLSSESIVTPEHGGEIDWKAAADVADALGRRAVCTNGSTGIRS